MPFVTKDHRSTPDMEIPGDRAFIEYRHIMREWREAPRWATVDALATRLFPDKHDRAYFLSFLVFFVTHGMQYEMTKVLENGDI